MSLKITFKIELFNYNSECVNMAFFHWRSLPRALFVNSVVACLKGGHHVQRINTLIEPKILTLPCSVQKVDFGRFHKLTYEFHCTTPKH